MTGNDPFTNALAGMDNAESVGHLSYTVEPASNIIGSVLEVLYDRGYVDGFEYVDDGKAGKFEVELERSDQRVWRRQAPLLRGCRRVREVGEAIPPRP